MTSKSKTGFGTAKSTAALAGSEESAKFLAAPTATAASLPVLALPHSVAARRERTTTINSWHSVCDLDPNAVICDDHAAAAAPFDASPERTSKSAEYENVEDDDIATLDEKPVGGGSADDDSLPVAPDGGWGWMCVLGCSVIHLILGGIGKSFGLIHVALTESLGESDFAVSWIHALSVACRMCMGPLSSMLFAKGFSCRQIVMVGGFISMSMYFASSLVVTSLSTLIVTMGVLVGFGGSLIYTPSILIVGQYFDTHKAMANGFAVMGTGLGALLMPIIIQTSLSNFGLSGALLILSGVSFHACVCGALYFPLRRKPRAFEEHKPVLRCHRSVREEEKAEAAKAAEASPLPSKKDPLVDTTENYATTTTTTAAAPTAKKNRRVVASLVRPPARSCLHALKRFFKEGIDVSLFRDSTFWVLTTSQFLSPIGFMPNLYYMPKLALALWAGDSLSVEERKVNAAFLISVNGIADIVGRAAFGVLTNYGFCKRHRALVYAACPLFCALGGLLAPFIGGRGFPYLAICAAATGCFSGGYVALTPSILSDALGREKLSSSFALTLAIKGIGAMLAAPIAGSIVSLSLSRDPDAMPYTGVYIFTACASSLSALVLTAWQMTVMRTRKTERATIVDVGA